MTSPLHTFISLDDLTWKDPKKEGTLAPTKPGMTKQISLKVMPFLDFISVLCYTRMLLLQVTAAIYNAK